MTSKADRERISHELDAMNRMVARTRLAMRKSEEKKAAGPPPSNSQYWRPKGKQAQEDAPWLKDGWSRR